jgi:hypothetical protein
MTDNLQQLAIATALKNMVEKGRVDICCIREINAMTGRVPDKKAFDTLHLLHCVSFSDMPPDLVKQIGTLIRDAIGGELLDLEVVNQVMNPPRAPVGPASTAARGLLRLFSR